MDQQVTLDELLAHVSALVDAVDVPVSVDAERCFADDAPGVAVSVERIAATGAAGISIEDYAPASGIDAIDVAVERVAAAAKVTRSTGIVLTARAENHLYGVDDLEDTITRLTAYHEAGADVVYAPWLADIAQIATVVTATAAPVNVLARVDGPGVSVLADIGVRRVSTGGGPGAAVVRLLRLHRKGAVDGGSPGRLWGIGDSRARSHRRPRSGDHIDAFHGLRPRRNGRLGRSARAPPDLPPARMGGARPGGDLVEDDIGDRGRSKPGRLEGV
jgi:hypothetical protein